MTTDGCLAVRPRFEVLRGDSRAIPGLLGYRPSEAGSITELLRTIATEAPELGAELQLALLRDLDRSIDSFDALHCS